MNKKSKIRDEFEVTPHCMICNKWVGTCVYINAGVGISKQKCKSGYIVVHQVDLLYSFAEVGTVKLIDSSVCKIVAD
jgi:hypothetical protein